MLGGGKLSRQNRQRKIISYVEETFYELAVFNANRRDQSLSDYIRYLLIKDLHEGKYVSEDDFASVVYSSPFAIIGEEDGALAD